MIPWSLRPPFAAFLAGIALSDDGCARNFPSPSFVPQPLLRVLRVLRASRLPDSDSVIFCSNLETGRRGHGRSASVPLSFNASGSAHNRSLGEPVLFPDFFCAVAAGKVAGRMGIGSMGWTRCKMMRCSPRRIYTAWPLPAFSRSRPKYVLAWLRLKLSASKLTVGRRGERFATFMA